MRILVSWSGGKDSQASLIWAANKYGASKIEAVFCDTGWENPITYLHVVDICKQMGVKLTVVRNKKYKRGMVDLAIQKKRFPSPKARFCTERLKTMPMIDYILDIEDHCIIIQGIRSDESASRSLMKKQCTYFRYYLAPYTDNIMKIRALKRRVRKAIKTGKKVKASDRKKIQTLKAKLDKGLLEQKFHTYRKKEVFAWVKKWADDIIRPYFNSTGSDVMNDIINAGQKPNPLYYMGRKRVGCDPCIMCSHIEVKAAVKFTPETIQRLRAASEEVGRSFFPPNYIPKRFCTGRDKNGKKYPVLDDVLKYLENGKMFVEEESQEAHRCMSFYGICE